MSSLAPTPHNAAEIGEIAPTVLMPGDPLRARYIAENWLESPREYNGVRGMLGYTGTYKGTAVSVQGHGIGIPSIGIYTHELFHFYGVEQIIRVGSAGAIAPGVQLGDMVAAMNVCTDSNYAAQYQLPGTYTPSADFGLLECAVRLAREKTMRLHVGTVLSSDLFYNEDETVLSRWAGMGVLAVEMEAMGLYCNAVRARKKALCITTVSDLPLEGKATSAEERQFGFAKMIDLALELACRQ